MIDYSKIVDNIADTMRSAGSPLTEDQRVLLVGSLSTQITNLNFDTEELLANYASLSGYYISNLTMLIYILLNEELSAETKKAVRKSLGDKTNEELIALIVKGR